MSNSDERLQNHVDEIAKTLNDGASYEYCPDCGADLPETNDDGEKDCPDCGRDCAGAMSGFDYLSDVLDVQYIVSADRKTVHGARFLVAFGGPNIWIDTQRKIVLGDWWGDHAEARYHTDAMDLDDTAETLWGC